MVVFYNTNIMIWVIWIMILVTFKFMIEVLNENALVLYLWILDNIISLSFHYHFRTRSIAAHVQWKQSHFPKSDKLSKPYTFLLNQTSWLSASIAICTYVSRRWYQCTWQNSGICSCWSGQYIYLHSCKGCWHTRWCLKWG